MAEERCAKYGITVRYPGRSCAPTTARWSRRSAPHLVGAGVAPSRLDLPGRLGAAADHRDRVVSRAVIVRMWEVQAHPEGVSDLLSWVCEAALPSLEVNPLYVSGEVFSSTETGWSRSSAGAATRCRCRTRRATWSRGRRTCGISARSTAERVSRPVEAQPAAMAGPRRPR